MEAGGEVTPPPLVVLESPNHRVVMIVGKYRGTSFYIERKEKDALETDSWRPIAEIVKPTGSTTDLSNALFELLNEGEMKP